MELEQLKNIWQKTTGSEGEGYFISRDELKKLMKKRSETSVAKIKRQMLLKVFLAGTISLLLIAFSIFSFTREEPVFSFLESVANYNVAIFYLIFGLVISFISGFNAFSYRKINKIMRLDQNLKTSLAAVLKTLNSAIQVKIYSDTLVIPISLLILIITDLILGDALFGDVNLLLIVTAGTIAYAIFANLVTRYVQKKKYGRQIQVLEECLEELNPDESGQRI